MMRRRVLVRTSTQFRRLPGIRADVWCVLFLCTLLPAQSSLSPAEIAKREAPKREAEKRLPALIADLKSSDYDVRCKAASTLGYLREGAKNAVPALIVALSDIAEVVRDEVAIALGNIGPEA